MSHSDKFWFDDPSILISPDRLTEFFPNKSFSLNEKLNSLARLGMYVSIVLVLHDKNVKWIKTQAEKLPVKNNTYDYYSISYGIRNVSDINKSLSEAFRVLKPGGRFMCLEFSKIDNELLNFFYKRYK